jgi:hypothetical protein
MNSRIGQYKEKARSIGEEKMKRLKPVFLVMIAVLVTLLSLGCEQYALSGEINSLIKKNDLAINMKVIDNTDGFALEKIYENDNNYYLKIDVKNTCSLRGEAEIKPGNKFRLSFKLKNIDADPVINYSFWKKPKTSLRHFTFKGENGNPPSSETQNFYNDWVTFEEYFETSEGEDSFMLTLHCRKGTFYMSEINIEQVK